MGVHAGVVGGIGTMMSVRQRPWHWNENQDRIRVVEHNVTSGAQALTLAGIAWEVGKISLADLTTGLENADEYCVVIREDTKAVLGVHKQGYGPIQNTAVADMADAILLAGPEGTFIDTAGSLFEPGKVVWMLVRLGDSEQRNLDSKYEPWLLICTSHDGSKAFSVRFVKVRVVCMNTFAMALSGTSALHVVRHTANAEQYLAEAREAVGMAVAADKAMDEAIARMLDTPLGLDRVLDQDKGLIVDVAGKRPEAEKDQAAWDRIFDGIVDAYMADHNTAIQDTAWGAVNAFQEYEQWGVRTRKPLAQAQMGRLLEGQWPLTAKALKVVTASKALAPV